MNNEWPPLKSCTQYRCGMLQPYLQKFDWEDDEDDETQIEYSYDNSDDEDDETVAPREFAFKPSLLKKFVEQVRTTRGYNVDDGMPQFMLSPFFRASLKDKYYEEWVNFAIEIAIEDINLKTGKIYKHVNTLNVVDAMRHRTLYLTFTAVAVAEELRKKVAAAAVVPEETFLAAVFIPVPSDPECYKLLECLLKPHGPAPWEYEELSSTC